MNRLSELIQELCPEGVEYKRIADFTSYEQPSRFIVKSTKYDDRYSTPVLTAGQSFILGFTNETDGIYKASKNNPVIIFDDFTGAFKWVDFDFKVKSSAMKIIKANESHAMLRYLYHIMGNIGFTSNEHKRLWIAFYSTIKIPLPPLPVQQEIVRILDCFTDLSAELKAELKARKKQYEYYRDNLLRFDTPVANLPQGKITQLIQEFCPEGVEYKSIKNIAEVGTGSSNGNEAQEEGAYPFFIRSQTVKNKDSWEYDEEAIIIPGEGGIGDIFHYINGKYALHQRVYRIHFLNDKINVKFAFYYFCSRFKQFILKKAVSATVKSIRKPMIEDFCIPIPPLPVQEEIVRILDNFDTRCNDLTTSLPAEIEARDKQYAYYRDKLLNFKELPSKSKEPAKYQHAELKPE